MKSAIITGATGAIGTALINKLIQQNVSILVFLREGSQRNRCIPEHPLITKKIYTLENLSDITNDTGKEYDVFYHFAWAGTTGAARDDMYLQNNNVKYALDAVNLAKKFGCKTFVGAGSQAEYGRVEGILKPDTPTNPETGYGMAKLCAGSMTRKMALAYNMTHVWVRVLSVYGPSDIENSMVMQAVKKFKSNIVPDFTKGEQLWDYLYSQDAAEAFYLVGSKCKESKVYVLGSGIARPLREYIEDIRKVVNPDCKVNLGAIEYAKNQVMHLEADITDLRNDVGFMPGVSFIDGIKCVNNSL